MESYSSLHTPALAPSSRDSTLVLQTQRTQCMAFTVKHAPSSVVLNNLVTAMLTVPLSQHTASACTFEDTQHLHLILLLFCQLVVIRKHASLFTSSLKKLRLLPRQNMKNMSIRFCGNLVDGTLFWPIRLVLHNFHSF